jgi:uncharacterized membrane protein YjgN (DUF898 family)
MDQITVPVHSPAGVTYSGQRSIFRRLVARGALLELVTFGFYRFWLTTDIRRHLWSNTSIGGDAVEYTGRAKDLLVGFLIALAVLVPLYLAYFLATLGVESMKAFASIPFYGFFYVLGQFAIYRARRYRLTRTVWRGVRFWMDGSAWRYAALATLWGLGNILTLGLLLPWREAALERYKMRHSFYGNLQGDFDGTGWELFKRGWWIWLALVGSAILALVLGTLKFRSGWHWAIAVVGLLIPFLYPVFKAIGWRWWLSGLRFGDVTLQSNLENTALYGCYWKPIGWGVVLGIAFTAFLALGGGLTAALQTESAMSELPMVVVTVLGYVTLLLASGFISRIYLVRNVWMYVATSIEVYGIETAYEALAEGELADAIGEGLADGLDVAGF